MGAALGPRLGSGMPPEPKVSREEIARAALAHIGAGGPESLSMRKLAQGLGIGTMTLYHHFPDKDAVVGAALDLVVEPLVALAADASLHGRARTLALALGMYDALAAHPGIHRLRAAGPLRRTTTSLVAEGIIASLLEAGVEPARAASGNLLILDYVAGSCAFTIMPEDATQLRAMEAILPADQFPAARSTTVALGKRYGRLTRRDMIEINVNTILDGLGAAQVSAPA